LFSLPISSIGISRYWNFSLLDLAECIALIGAALAWIWADERHTKEDRHGLSGFLENTPSQ
jgi:hypothetical protein